MQSECHNADTSFSIAVSERCCERLTFATTVAWRFVVLIQAPWRRWEALGTFPDSRAAVPCEQPDPKMDAQNFTPTFTRFYNTAVKKRHNMCSSVFQLAKCTIQKINLLKTKYEIIQQK